MDQSNKYQVLLNQMLTLQLITAEEYDQLKEQEDHFKEELEPFPDYPVAIPAILATVSKGIMRDAESGTIPPDYQRLVPEIFKLIEKDTGRPKVELVYENVAEGNDLYSLVLTFENDKFERTLQDVGDYYDVNGLLKMINEILNFSNLDYNIISIESNDQAFWWLKGKREKVEQLFALYELAYFVDQ